MERLSNTRRSSGFNCGALRLWGLLFAVSGVVSRGILQNRILGLDSLTSEQLMEVLESSGSGMTIATVSLALQLLETCAVPIFAWLLVKGVEHTSDLKKYALRVTGLALLSEIPFDLAFGGTSFDMSVQNPVFGMVLGLVMMAFFQQYAGKSVKNVAIKLLVTVMALIWAVMLRIDHGLCVVLIVAALWLTRGKPMMQNLFGATAAICCSMVNIFYMMSPMVFLAIHFCNGEKGESSRAVNYLAYPVMLLAVGIGAMFLI